MKAKYINPFTDLEKAELARLNHIELDRYESCLKNYRDLKNVIDTAFDEGKMEGRTEGKLEGKLEVAKALKASGLSIEIIGAATGLSKEQIEKL